MSTGQRPAPPAPQATAAVTAMPLKVSVHLAPYNGVSSVVQWWMNFITYIELFQMTNDQTLNILPFLFYRTSQALVLPATVDHKSFPNKF